MSVLRYYGCTDLCIRIFGSLVCNISLISDLCLVLCCDIYRSTLISIMYPACMITVHDRKSRALHAPCTWTCDLICDLTYDSTKNMCCESNKRMTQKFLKEEQIPMCFMSKTQNFNKVY